MRKISFILACVISLAWVGISRSQISDIDLQADGEQFKVTFMLQLPANHYLYKDSLKIRSDHPDVLIKSWRPLTPSVERYDNSFKEVKNIYQGKVPFELFLIAQKELKEIVNPALHLIYHTNNTQSPVEDMIVPLSFTKQSENDLSDQHTPILPPVTCKVISSPTETLDQVATPENPRVSQSWSTYISNLITEQKGTGLKLFLIFFLGFLLSLTPCIYPMIPITIGVLQAQPGANKSLLKNFGRALMYTIGLSTTFALFGLLASCVGPLCGQLLSNKFFVMALVAILFSFALSMLGLYEIRIPFASIPQFSSNSFLAPFIFGAASGTFASPCVSPGLALVLSIAATLGNKFLGFIFLFVFGVGLSIPLLAIGTLSTLINFLPKAGIWMIEIKKLFGLLMIGTCLFYLSFVISTPTLYFLSAIVSFALALFYLKNAGKLHRTLWRPLSYGIALLLIVTGMIFGYMGVKTRFLPSSTSQDLIKWRVAYQEALVEAQTSKKLLFVDAWAPYCSICVAINKKVLVNPTLVKALERYVPVKVDMSDSTTNSLKEFRDKFEIVGVPVCMIVDPMTEKVLKKWGSEIYSMPIEQIVQEIEKARLK